MAISYDLTWFKQLVLSCDPTATKFHGSGAESQTVWTPKRARLFESDNAQSIIGWEVEVSRECKADRDAVAAALLAAFQDSERVEFSYAELYDPDDGTHQHLFTCEVH